MQKAEETLREVFLVSLSELSGTRSFTEWQALFALAPLVAAPVPQTSGLSPSPDELTAVVGAAFHVS